MTPTLPAWPLVDEIIDRALAEDLAGGDLTSEACIDENTRARGIFVARNEMVVSGLPIAARVFERLDASTEKTIHVRDATRVDAKTALMEVRGLARTLLAGERVALNLVQRLSGIATLTRTHVDALPKGSTTRIVDTRKTTPGLRAIERYAVRCGGGFNHRDTLGSAVLIKDNHVVAAGSVTAAITRARSWAPHTSKIECEVDSLAQLDEALAAGADVVLLDNMDDATVAKAVATIRAQPHRVQVEASGGITLERIAALARVGVDVISVGALTHSPKAADIGLDFV